MDDKRIDAILKATEYHVEFLNGGKDALDGREPTGFNRGGFGVYARTTGNTIAAHVGDRALTDNERRHVAQVVADALTNLGELRAAVIHYREALRRAALLTLETADEICAGAPGFICYTDDGGGVIVENLDDEDCDDAMWLFTIGQLEDAIKQAKETNA